MMNAKAFQRNLSSGTGEEKEIFVEKCFMCGSYGFRDIPENR